MPSLNVTVPVGINAPVPPVTLAEKVMLVPTTAEEADAVRAVVVDAAATLIATAEEADARFRESPP